MEKLEKLARYAELKEEIKQYNSEHTCRKRGIGVVPVKFGISFTTAFLNQGSALIWIYSDGSISLSHGGIEMGQEVNTKCAQIVARILGVNLNRIRHESSNTKRTANASPTAASSGSDINGSATKIAADKLRTRLVAVAQTMLKENYQLQGEDIVFADDCIYLESSPKQFLRFEDVVQRAYISSVDLGAHGFYSTPGIYYDRDAGKGNPFYYFVYGCGLVTMEVDVMTGMSKLLDVVLVHETGLSLNPEIDKGQIIGAFYQGYGWSVMEEEVFNTEGNYMALTPSTYKFPCIRDYPQNLQVEMINRKRHHASVMGSKGIGEPPLVYGTAAWFAIKDAIESLYDYTREADLAMPATPEAVLLAIADMAEKGE
jgi:xanthine dehydrogenase large subunit